MLEKNKTVWVINQFAGTATSGWGERHFYFSKYWKNQAFNPVIISGTYNHMFNKLPKVEGQYTQENYEGVDFCWVKTPKYKATSMMRFWSFFVFAFKVLFIDTSKFGKPDVIIVSSMPIFPILSGFLLKRRYKATALIFEIRDIWPLTLQLLGGYKHTHPAVKFIGWFEKFGYKKADIIVSLLPNAKEHFETIAKAGHKMVYIPNGLDENVLESEAAPEELVRQIPKDKFVLGYTGTIGLANALEYLVEAAGLLQDDSRFYFVIIGDGYLKKELTEKSKSFGNVLFYPKIRKNQVADVVRLFDVCFVGRNDTPLFKHGVSANKYFDYMLAGKPILDSNNHIKDPVELSEGGLIVKPDSAEAIKEGILELYNLPVAEREKMGMKGREYVITHHNLKGLSDKYLDLFSKG